MMGYRHTGQILFIRPKLYENRKVTAIRLSMPPLRNNDEAASVQALISSGTRGLDRQAPHRIDSPAGNELKGRRPIVKILLDYPLPFALAHGGVQVQIEQTKAALEQLGLEVEFLRWWDDRQTGDVIHYFGRMPAAHVEFAQQ